MFLFRPLISDEFTDPLKAYRILYETLEKYILHHQRPLKLQRTSRSWIDFYALSGEEWYCLTM